MEKKTFSRIGFGVLVGWFISTILTFVITVLVFFGFIYISMGAFTIVTYVILYGSYILTLWLIVHRLPEYPQQEGLAGGGKAIGLVFAAAVVGLCANDFLYVVGSYINDVISWMMFGNTNDIMSLLPKETLGSFSWEQFFTICVIAPVCEEILFRGLVMKKLLPFGDLCAILVSGALFGLFHGNFQQMFYAASGGLCLGYVYARTGKLRYPIAVHTLVNLFSYLGPMLQAVGLSAELVPRLLYGFSVATWIGAAFLLHTFFRKRILRAAPCRFVNQPGPRMILTSAGMITNVSIMIAVSVIAIALTNFLQHIAI